MNKLRIVIADDERPAREFLKAILREFEDVEIVGEAENGADAVEIIKQTKPDLALLDLQMPEISGLEAVRLLRKSQMPLVAFVTASIRHTEAKARWPILEGLADRTEFGNDRTLPLLTWYQMVFQHPIHQARVPP